MGVQVPQLQQIQPSPAQPKTERISIQAQTSAPDILKRTQAVTSLGGEIANVVKDVENKKINTLGQEVERDFNNWNVSKLQELKSFQGDPTDAYAQYDKDVNEKYEALITSRPDLNERVKRHVTSHLDGVVRNNNYQSLKQRGAQQETYDNSLYESSVNIKRDSLSVNAGHIQKDNPGSYFFFDQNLNDLATTIAKRSVDKGSGTIVDKDSTNFNHQYRDADGEMVKVKLNDNAKLRLAQERSRGVSESIKGMINAGYTEKAKQAYERYRPYVDSKTKITIDKKFKTADIEGAAFKRVGEIEKLHIDKRFDASEKIKDPELKNKVQGILKTNNNRRDTERKRKANDSYERIAKDVLARKNAGKPYNGTSELESSQLYKMTWEDLDVKGQKTITEMIEAPKKSSESSLFKVNQLILGDDKDFNIENMSLETFHKEFLTGLSDADRKRFTTKFTNLRDPAAGQQRATFSLANKMLKDRMLIDGNIKKVDGFLSAKDEKKLLKQQDKLIEFLGDEVKDLNNKEIQDKIREFSAQDIKDNSSSGFFSSLFGSGEVESPNVAVRKMSAIELKKEFKNTNGYFPTSSDPKFKTFLKNKGLK